MKSPKEEEAMLAALERVELLERAKAKREAFFIGLPCATHDNSANLMLLQ